MYIKKYINDNVYGGIGFTEKEFEIINTPTFQRLRRIKQQGLTNLTFPSSDHSRFSHSLGVLHIMGKIAEHLELEEREIKLLRYAALLHDIGHYPLSHLTESVYITKSNSISSYDIPLSMSPLLFFAKKPKSNDANHEGLGAEVLKKRRDIRKILKSDGFDEPEEIGEIITGNTGNHLHHQLMHSSFDADRLDYLLRDSSAAGVNYGMIDLEYLVRLIGKGDGKIFDEGRERTVSLAGINVKGVHSLEHYLMARYFSYSQISMHRTTTVFETLAKAIIWYLADKNKIYADYSAIKKIIGKQDFLAFDDSLLWGKIGRKKLFKDSEIYLDYRDALIERKRLKILFEEKTIVKKGDGCDQQSRYGKLQNFVENSFTQIAEMLDIPIHRIGYTEQNLEVDLSSTQIQFNAKKYVEASRVFDRGTVKLLLECDSCFIKAMFEKELRIFRLFYIDPWPYDKRRSDRLAELARACIEQQIG